MAGVSGATQLIGGAVTDVNVTDCDIAGVDAANVGHARHPLEAAQQTCGDAIGIVVGSPAICKRRGGAYPPRGSKPRMGWPWPKMACSEGATFTASNVPEPPGPPGLTVLFLVGFFFPLIDAIVS